MKRLMASTLFAILLYSGGARGAIDFGDNPVGLTNPSVSSGSGEVVANQSGTAKKTHTGFKIDGLDYTITGTTKAQLVAVEWTAWREYTFTDEDVVNPQVFGDTVITFGGGGGYLSFEGLSSPIGSGFGVGADGARVSKLIDNTDGEISWNTTAGYSLGAATPPLTLRLSYRLQFVPYADGATVRITSSYGSAIRSSSLPALGTWARALLVALLIGAAARQWRVAERTNWLRF